MLSCCLTSGSGDPERPSTTESVLYNRFTLQCAISCVQAASEAIEIVFNENSPFVTDSEYLSAWWYNVLYLYNSATVLIAARLNSAIVAEISEESILDSWGKAIQLMERYCVLGTSIRRMVTTLSLLFDAIPQQYSRLRQIARQSNLTDIQLPQQGLTDQLNAGLPLPEATGEFDFDDENNMVPRDSMFSFDEVFDPNDLSWLLTLPLEVA